jgi:very-short-patch-repair endonuclease
MTLYQKNKEKIIREKYNGIHPVCGCGCGMETIYNDGKKDFGKFKRGHRAKIYSDHFGDPKNPERVKKIISTRKRKFKNGDYDHVVESIKENRKNPTLGEKISKGAKGIPKPKPNGFGVGRKHSENTKNKMSTSAIDRIIKTDKLHSSRLEDIFASILDNLNIRYTRFFYAKDIKAFYDFFLPSYNTIIEVDGDFYHCNPSTQYAVPLYASQKNNIKRDKQKNKWVEDNGFEIIRFWEYDINNNREFIINTLRQLK